MSARGEAKPVYMLLHHVLRFLDPLGYFYLLLAGEQRDLAHLFEIHANRIIQNVELRFRLFVFILIRVLFSILMPIDLGGFDDVDLHPAQSG